MTKQEFLARFNETHGSYISVSREVLENFYDNYYNVYVENDPEGFLDLAKDYILYQDLAEEVV